MPELLRRLARLLSAQRSGPEPRWPGRPALLRGDAALAGVEEQMESTTASRSAGESARAMLAEAAGLALSGLRTSAWVPADALAQVHAPLEEAAARCSPFLVHASFPTTPGHGSGPGQGGAPVIADTGAFVIVPRDAQQALDFLLVARRVSELGLAPGVLVLDGREIASAVRPLSLPEDELVADYLGRADDAIESPTPAQVLLFGDERRRVPRWFDPDRPTAHGVLPRGADLAAALAGRRRFFSDCLAPLASDAMETLGALTGRPLSFVTKHRLDDARHVLVAQGSAVELAEAVADALRAEGLKAGVLGVSWLRPFPAQELGKALGSAATVTVLERSVDALAGLPPLARELRASGAADGRVLLSGQFGVGGQALRGSDIAVAFRNAAVEEGRRDRFWLGVSAPEADARFPKRQALLQRLQRDHPDLEESVLPAAGALIDSRPEAARTVTLQAFRPEERDLAERLAEAMSAAAGPAVVVRRLPAEPDCLRLSATAARSPFRDPGDGIEAELCLLLGHAAPVALDPLETLAQGGTCAVATPLASDELREALPESWRATLEARGQRLLRIDPGAEALLAALPVLLAGEAVGDEVRAPDEAQGEEQADIELPLAVRRFRRSGETHDNVARFWGEVAQPRIAGDTGPPVPDPYLAVGAVPSATATFHDMSAERATLPLVSAEHCTGCGACWTACPDSSIAPTAVRVEGLLRVAQERAWSLAPGPPDAGRRQLQRSLPQLAARVESRLAKEGAESLEPELISAAADWLAGKLELPAEERTAFEASVGELRNSLCRAPLAVTQPFFHGPKAQGGKPELLALAVNPQSCQGCGGCAEVCPSDAIEIASQRPEHVERLASAWGDWERLPDTPGVTLARAADEIGELEALLLSRHVFFAVAGGDGAEPGSGERLALRQVSAVLEARGQGLALARAARLESIATELQEALKTTLTGAVELSDLAAVEDALADEAGELRQRLQDAGATAVIDETRARDLVAAARDLADLRERCLEGPSGIGRSRFALVVTGPRLADWAASFPRNPFSVPVALDMSGSGPELAAGLLRGLLERGLDEERRIRSARLLLADAPERARAESELGSLSWQRLLAEEPGAAPTLLVLGDSSSLVGEEAAGLSRLLASDLPVKVLLLDDGSGEEGSIDPVFLALAHRRAFVLSASVGHEEQLHEGLVAALGFEGPALIRIHAPSPRRDGFSTERLVERARAAVRCRVQPLLRYDPREEGVFGTRLSLAGNPDEAEVWVRSESGHSSTPVDWALGAERWAAGFGPAADDDLALADWLALPPADRRRREAKVTCKGSETLRVPRSVLALLEDRAESWATLQELAGRVTPFTAAVRDEAEQQLSDAHQAELAARDESHRRELAEGEAQARSRQAAALTERLLRMAGYAGDGAAGS